MRASSYWWQRKRWRNHPSLHTLLLMPAEASVVSESSWTFFRWLRNCHLFLDYDRREGCVPGWDEGLSSRSGMLYWLCRCRPRISIFTWSAKWKKYSVCAIVAKHIVSSVILRSRPFFQTGQLNRTLLLHFLVDAPLAQSKCWYHGRPLEGFRPPVFSFGNSLLIWSFNDLFIYS